MKFSRLQNPLAFQWANSSIFPTRYLQTAFFVQWFLFFAHGGTVAFMHAGPYYHHNGLPLGCGLLLTLLNNGMLTFSVISTCKYRPFSKINKLQQLL